MMLMIPNSTEYSCFQNKSVDLFDYMLLSYRLNHRFIIDPLIGFSVIAQKQPGPPSGQNRAPLVVTNVCGLGPLARDASMQPPTGGDEVITADRKHWALR